MMMVNAKSGLWSIKCPCGARFEIGGNKILNIDILTCLNCGRNADLLNLKEAVNSLLALQSSIVKATKHDQMHWEINPPAI